MQSKLVRATPSTRTSDYAARGRLSGPDRRVRYLEQVFLASFFSVFFLLQQPISMPLLLTGVRVHSAQSLTYYD